MNEETKTDRLDPFLQRAIEYWLDAVNELGYTPLFCAWLSNTGYIVKHFSKSGPFEQGKDVIAVDATGIAHAYQLKGGDINLNRWRTEVRPEIEVLIDIPIKHPDIDKNKQHVSYLVTNGELEDAVRVEIDDLNEHKWKTTPLHVIRRGDLLHHFQEMASGILPKDAETYKQLMDLMFANSSALPDFDQANSFLAKIFRIEESVSKEQRKRDVAAAVLYTNLIVGPYRRRENHVSVVRVLVLLMSHILLSAERHDLQDKYWIEAYHAVWADLLATTRLLEAEINDDGFAKAFDSPMDRDLMPLRKHIATLFVLALKVSELVAEDGAWKNIVPDFQEKYKEVVALWGEASLIPFIFLTLIFRNVEGGEPSAYQFAQHAIDQIIALNGRKAKERPGLLPPYYDVDFAVKRAFKLIEEDFEEDYRHASYYLKPLIELLARAGQRSILSARWQDISFIRFEQYMPDADWHYYLWRSPGGENATFEVEKVQSWAKLVEAAGQMNGGKLPRLLKRFPEFIPFFLATFPQRLDVETLGYLDMMSIKPDSSE